MEPLSPSFRRELRARAHALDPVVAIGHHGLTPSVLHEIDVALKAHELVKVRVFNDDRDERQALLARIVDELDCAPVQTIGKLLVLYRPRPIEDNGADLVRVDAGGATRARKQAARGHRAARDPRAQARCPKGAGRRAARRPAAPAPHGLTVQIRSTTRSHV